MQRALPVRRSSCEAAGWLRPALQIVCSAALGAAALAAAQQAPPASAPAAAASGFVGQETCAACHVEVVKGFSGNAHVQIAEMRGRQGVTCEGCHGPGKAHVESGGDKSKIFDPATAVAKDVDKTCLSCHAGQHPNFRQASHAKAGVSCIGCHGIHQSKEEKLLKASEPKLCFQCHTDVKPQFSMPFHHRVEEGLVKCNDCHDAHGTFEKANLKSTADQNAICTKCHMEKRGPFVFEHTPVKAEGCTSCHTPHGSQNARLLNMPTIATLCNQCHSGVGAGAVHGMAPGSTTVLPCIDCHTFIHGSNMNAAFFR
jgi:DmsE family decaheme c-type cytochrome